MPLPCAARGLLALALWTFATQAWCQGTDPLIAPPSLPGGEFRPTSANSTDLPYKPFANLLQEPPAATPLAPAQASLQHLKLDDAFLPGIGHNGLQINDIEASATAAFSFADGCAPLLITPGFAAHFWQGRGAPNLPGSLYDAYVEFEWRPRLARWLFADLTVTPGVYGDFKDLRSDDVQMRGRGLAIVALSPQLQLVGGVLYVNRLHTKVLPAGGVIWNPDDDTKLNFLFPQPKFARRLATFGDTQWWAYLGGEFGGGRWSVESANDSALAIDYTDARVLIGLERLVPRGPNGHVELGYVFARRVSFGNSAPDYKPDGTLLLRAGFNF
jgi:Domain of unknown function (DUF6268)